MTSKIRVRFAPSPTGPLHIGGLRTALFNYLWAKKKGGDFILRIEDTDQKRLVPWSTAYINESLAWLGITPDEGPMQGGGYGPYRQSERKALYAPYIKQLIEKGAAYYAFDLPEELEAMRLRQKKLGNPSPSYNAITRLGMKNSLTLTPGQLQEAFEKKVPYVIRMRIDPTQKVRFHDEVRGWIEVSGDTLDDKVLCKSDGMPTYHLANVIDDHLMAITHVIRGEEWLPSTPLHTLLYRAFDWEPPIFVHLPLLLKKNGQGKLSKRAHAEEDYLVFPLSWADASNDGKAAGFRESGYLPEAVINFLALLGWHGSDNREHYTITELIEAFSLKRIKKTGVRFDMEKARWFNQYHTNQWSNKKLIDTYIKPQLTAEEIPYREEQLNFICAAVKPRLIFPQNLWEMVRFFFCPPLLDLAHRPKGWEKERVLALLKHIQAMIQEGRTLFEVEILEKGVKSAVKSEGFSLGVGLPILRWILSGEEKGMPLGVIFKGLGQKEVVERLDKFIGLCF